MKNKLKYQFWFDVVFFSTIILITFVFRPPISESGGQFYLQFYIGLVIIVFFYVFLYRFPTKNWISLEIIFIFSFLIVHFQWGFMAGVLQEIPDDYILNLGNYKYLSFSTWLSLVGFESLLFGYTLKGGFIKSASREVSFKADDFRLLDLWRLKVVSTVLFILFLGTAGSDFLSGGVYKGSGGVAHAQGIAAYIQLFLSIVILLLTGLTLLKNLHKYKGNFIAWFLNFDMLFLVLFFSYVILFLMIGDRGGPLGLSLVILLFTGTFCRSFSLLKFFAIITFGGFFLSIISIGRSQGVGLEMLMYGIGNYEISSASDLTLELANSSRALVQAVANVPSSYSYFYGLLWISEIFSVIPFLQSIIFGVLEIDSMALNSANFITFLTYGTDATSGEGTTIIADIYLNFGVAGVLVGMFILGVLMISIGRFTISKNFLISFVFFIVFSYFAVYFARSSFFTLLRPCFFSVIFLYLFVNFGHLWKK